MPTIRWNKRWGRQISDHVKAGDAFLWGCHWGDPRLLPPLSAVVEQYITPFVRPDTVAMEIGPGGGRWTQFLIGVRELVLVELNPEFFPYLRERFGEESTTLRCYQTKGAELDGIASGSIDFVFSFGVFVHVEPSDIDRYLGHLERVLRPSGRTVIQYADKTKPAAKENDSFSNMTAASMEAYVAPRAFTIEEHNTTLISHSNVIVLRKSAAG